MKEEITRILLIDDDEGDVQLVCEILAETFPGKYGVQSCARLSEGLALLEEEFFDVILLGLHLPDSQGEATVQNADIKALDFPIIVLTDLDDEALAFKAVQAGAQDYLVKGEFNGKLLPRSIDYAIERHQLKKQILEISITDGLTGLYNRNGFFTLAEQQIKLAQRAKGELLFFFIDVDGLKLINDRYGHPAGDRALEATAEILHKTFRDSDILGRAGGDEFVVLAVDSQAQDKASILQRLEAERVLFLGYRKEEFVLNFSVGVAAWSFLEPKSLDVLMREADTAMCRHKRAKQKRGRQNEQPVDAFVLDEGAFDPDALGISGEIRILLVEDNPDDARLIQEYLREVDPGYQVIHVARLSEAMAYLQEQHPSLVLLDLSLPDSYGLGTLERIVTASIDVPLVVMTGLDDQDMAVKALQLGAQDYLTKGMFDEVLLGRAVQYAFERYQLNMQNKLYAQELQRSETRLKSIFNNVAIGMYRATPEGEICFANRALIEMMGFDTFEQLASRNLEENGFIDRAYRQEFKRRLEEDGYVVGLEAMWQKADGSVMFVRESAKAIRTADGTPLYYEGTAEDITAQIEAQKQLRLQSAALDAAANAVVITDRAGDIIWVNPAFEDLTGYTAPEILGKNPRILNSGMQDERFYKSFWETISSGMVWQGEMVNRRKDGGHYTEQMTVAPLKDAMGEITHFIAIKEDITSRKMAEEITRRHLDEMKVLNAVAQAGVEETDEDCLIERVTQIIGENLYSDHFGVMLLDQQRGVLVVHPSYRGLPESFALHEIKISDGVVGPVAATGRSRRVPDVREVPEFISATLGIRSGLCVPLLAGERVIGVVNAESKQLDAFSQEDERLLTTVAGQLATAIEQLRHQKAEHEQRIRAEALSNTALALNSSLAFDQIMEQVLDNVARIIPHQASNIMLNENGTTRVARHRRLDEGADTSWIDGRVFVIAQTRNLKSMLDTGEPLIVPDVREYSDWTLLPGGEWIRSHLGVPIRKDSNTFGFLTLDHSTPGFYTDSHAKTLQVLAHQLAIAMDNARLFAETQQNLKDLRLVFEASQEYAGASLEPQEIALEVARHFVEILGFYECTVSIFGSSNDTLIALVDYFKDPGQPGKFWPDWLNKEISLADYPATAHVIETLEPLIVHASDPNADPAELAYMQNEGMVTLIILPLVVKGEAVGIIELEEENRERHLSERELNLAMTLANQVATALENASLYAEAQKRANELSRLYDASGALLVSDPSDLPALSRAIVDTIRTEFGTSNCSLFLVDTNSDCLVRSAASGPYSAEVFSGQELFVDGPGIAPSAIRERQLVNVPDVTRWPDYVPNWKEARSEMAIPLIVGEEVIGVIDVQSTQEGAFSNDDERIVSVFAEQAALALENGRLYQRQQQQLDFLESLHQIDLAITGSMDLQVTLDVVAKQIINQLSADAASILLLDPLALSLEPIASSGFSSEDIKNRILRVGEGLGGLVAQKGNAVYRICLADEACPECERSEIFIKEGFISYYGLPLTAKGQIKGVLEMFLRQPFQPDQEWENFAVTVATQAAIAIDNASMFENLEKSNLELSLAYDTTLEGWAKALELRDSETEGHSRRVVEMTLKLGRKMGIVGFNLVHIRRGVLLHDIGKMGVPDSILQKHGPLDDGEWEIMRLHPVYAYEWLSSINYLRQALDIPHYHHERWDGTGYPDGLVGEQIPLPARIFAVVDVWDALRSDRPYREAWSYEKTLSYIQKQSGSHFDPRVVEVFMELVESSHYQDS